MLHDYRIALICETVCYALQYALCMLQISVLKEDIAKEKDGGGGAAKPNLMKTAFGVMSTTNDRSQHGTTHCNWWKMWHVSASYSSKSTYSINSK